MIKIQLKDGGEGIYTYGYIYIHTGMYTHILLYLERLTNKDLLYSTGNPAQCYVAAWMGGEFGGEWKHVRVWLNPFAVDLKLSQHWLLISNEAMNFSHSVCTAT